MSSSSSLDCLELCRLCLEKERVSVPIFENEGDVRQIFLKITACLPVKVSRDDKLPKKICDDCLYKVELFYQFWNTTANAEKQLLQWLGEVGGLEDGVPEVLVSNVMKQEQASDSRLEGRVVQVGGQNSVDMGMIENMTIITMPVDGEQQFASVPMDTSGTVTVQAVASSSASANDQSQTSVSHLADEVEDDDDDDDDDGCDNEGMPVKEENEEDQSDRVLDQSSFVTIPCDEAGPSGLQQKIADISNMSLQPTEVNDPKTGLVVKSEDPENFISIKMEPLPTLPPKPRSFILPQSSTSKTSTTPVRPIIRPILRPIIRPSASTSGAPPKAPSAILTPVPLRLLQSAKTVTPIKRPPILPRPQIQPMLVYPPNQGQQQVKPPILLLPRPNQRKPMIFLPKPFTPAASSSSSSSTQNQSSQPQQKRNNVIQQPGTRYKRKRGRRGILLGEIEAPDQTEGVPGDDVGEDYIKLPNGRFQCTICNHTHCNLQCIKKHVSTVHKSMKLFKCPDCDKTFRQAYILRKHQKVHERQKPDAPTYGCDQCDYRTKHKFYIQSHIYRVHTDDYLFTCDRCGKRFKMKRELKDHQVLHNDETHICDICGKIFKGKHLLRNHKRNHTITDDFQCKTCRRKLCTQEALDKHMKLHNRVYECVDCGSQYGNKVSLEKHRNVHTRANAHECPMCHKVFADQATQKVHSLTHAGLKPYKCNVCGAGFTQRTPMMIHWRRKHPGETEPPPPVVLTGILKEMEEQLSTSKVPHANPE